MIRAGQLRLQVTLQAQGLAVADSFGSADPWAVVTDVATIWARIETPSSNEDLLAGKVQASTTHVVTIRYRSDVTAAHRLKWGTKYLYIDSVVPDERLTALTLICHARA